MAYTTIDKSDDYFNTKLWSGNSTTSTGITGVGFQPDLVWIKNRTDTNSHALFDVIRTATNYIESDTTDAEATNSEFLQSFDSDGFTLGDAGRVNISGQNYVGWSWLAGGTASSNSDGSITSNVSANITSGFSIVSYTGTGATANVGHGLGSAPKMIIVKQTNTTRNWVVGHDSIGWTKYLYLDSTNAEGTANLFNNTDPSSTVFDVVNDSGVNASGGTYIAYCFAEKKGFSKFGSYTGNGSTDGTFVYTGFKPSLVILKRTDSAGTDWNLVDNKRAGFNPDNYFLAPNSTGTENSVNDIIDLFSNGFKLTSASGASNISGGTYIYMAFASNPFVTSTGIPATAR